MDLRELSQELDDEVESQSTSFSSDEEQDQDSEDEKFDNDSIIQEDESYDPISVDEISSVLGVRIQVCSSFILSSTFLSTFFV